MTVRLIAVLVKKGPDVAARPFALVPGKLVIYCRVSLSSNPTFQSSALT